MSYTITSCPHCRKMLDAAPTKFEEHTIAPSYSFSCPKCGKEIRSKEREWAHATESERSAEWGIVYRECALAFILGSLLAFALPVLFVYFIIKPVESDSTLLFAWGFVSLVLGGIAASKTYKNEKEKLEALIEESLNRTEGREK